MIEVRIFVILIPLMREIFIGTNNKGKQTEFKKFLSVLPVNIIFPQDLGIKDSPSEHANTYKENSEAKALYFAKASGLPTISDDGGIEIVALNNEPGVKSRRWLGYEATDEQLIEHMKKVSKELPDDNRDAYFRDVVSLALPSGEVFNVNGEVKGIIHKKPLLKILKGYPYRSFFYLPQIDKYYHEADLTEDEEKQYNHRYIAVQKLLPIIRRELKL